MRNMKSKVLVLIIVLSVLFVILLPLVVDWLIVGNNFPSNISNSDWVSFLGSYIGAIIGGAVSLFGIAWTVRFTREENRKDRALQVRPYPVVRFVPNSKLRDSTAILFCGFLSFEPFDVSNSTICSVIYIRKSGFGPAVDLSMIGEVEKSKKMHSHFCFTRIDSFKEGQVETILPGQEVGVPIQISFYFDPIKKEEIQEPHKLMLKYPSFDMKIKFGYHDLFGNKFEQIITIRVNISLNIDSSRANAKYEVDLVLSQPAQPVLYTKGR